MDQDVDEWALRHLLEPTASLLAALAVGEVVESGPEVDRLGIGIEGTFRSQIAHQYEGWPEGSTTDGIGVDRCWRSAARTIDVVGLAWLDFAGDIFPWRAELAAEATGGEVSVAIDIGNVDAVSGEPPRYGRGTILLPSDGAVSVIVGRRALPIAWTPAIALRFA